MNPIYSNLTIFFSLLLLCNSIPSNGLITSCITTYNETVNNQTGLIDDPYRANVLALFTAFTSSSSSFYNTTIGESLNKAYGLYLCRGDTNTDTCRTCISSLTSTWATTLNDCKEGVAFLDECMVHYANYSFFGEANDSIRGVQVGKGFSNASQDYNITMDSVLQDVASDAYKSMNLYASSVTTYVDQGEVEKVYALAQCTPDIVRNECRECLIAAKSYLRANVTGVAKSAWALVPSCQLRYDNVSFFGATSAGSSPTLPSVSGFLLTIFSLLFVSSLIH